MKKLPFILPSLLLLPQFALALDPPRDIQTFGVYLVSFLSIYIVPLFFSIALVIFIFNVVRYFIINNGNFDYKEKARRYALYSVIGMILMTMIWGITNLVAGGLGFDRTQPVCPDYFDSEECARMQPGGFGAAEWDEPI